MKPLVKLLHLFATLLFLLLFNTSHATQCDSIRNGKVIRKEQAFSSKGLLELKNEFGDINIHTWNKERLSLVITVRVIGGSDKSAQKLLKGVNFRFSEQFQRFSARTQLSRSVTRPENVRKIVMETDDLGNRKTTIKGRRSPYLEIDYELHVPQSAVMQIKNSFGDVYIQNSTNTVSASVSYGDLRTGKLHFVKALTLKFGEVDIASAKTISRFRAEYSEGDIGPLSSVEISNHFSDISFSKVSSIKGLAEYGSLSIEDADEINITAKFCELSISKVSSLLAVNAHYVSKGRISGIGNQVKQINLSLNFSTFRVRFDNGADYQAQLNGKFSTFRFSNKTHTILKERSKIGEDYYLLKRGQGDSRFNVTAQYSQLSF